MNDGNESVPVALNQEVTFQTASGHIAISTEGDHCDNDYSADDSLFIPSIEDVVVEKHQSRRRRRRPHGAAGVRPHSYEMPNNLKPKMRSANMAFSSKDDDQAERLLSEISKEAPPAAATNRTLGVSYEAHGKQDPALDCLMQAPQSDLRANRPLIAADSFVKLFKFDPFQC